VEAAVLDRWSCLGAEAGFAVGETASRLLGVDLTVAKDADGAVAVREAGGGRALPVLPRYGHVWTSLGEPAGGIAAIPEADEPDRRVVLCGAVHVRASAPRVVENFLDMAHFPYVHTDILGSEPHTEVRRYEARIRRDLDEVWATDCRFVQPQAALSAAGAIDTEYVYRVLSPFDVMLYKTCPNAADRRDAICLFVQPLDPDRCVAHPAMFLIDDASALTDLVHFQQVIFLQDRIILENQRPRLLPLEPRAEIPTRADASSVIYRRWLKEKGVRYGTTLAA
jgi:phenylpropionate dioxygenase-like ring-hydroxylating dioxygenase large terminal subunit